VIIREYNTCETIVLLLQSKTTAGTRKEVVVAALKKQLAEAQHALVKRKKQMKNEGDSILQDAAIDFLGLRSGDVDSLQEVFDEIDVKEKGYIRVKDFFTSMEYVHKTSRQHAYICVSLTYFAALQGIHYTIPYFTSWIQNSRAKLPFPFSCEPFARFVCLARMS
jgi:hypothetical protein